MTQKNLFEPPEPPPFSIECCGLGEYGCDPGDHLGSQDEAESEGWTQIELILEAEASPMANYRGLCPICSAIEAKENDDKEVRERIEADKADRREKHEAARHDPSRPDSPLPSASVDAG
jgi:hypothetical protein